MLGAAGRARAVHRRSAFALARLLWTRGPMRILALAVALTAAEWLRGHLLTGFPVEHSAMRSPAAGAGAGRRAGRDLGTDVLRGRVFASPAVLADERARHAAALAGRSRVAARHPGARSRPSAPCGSRGRRPRSSPACGCASCSRTCRRTTSSTTRPSSSVMDRYIALSDRSDRSGRDRRARRRRI